MRYDRVFRTRGNSINIIKIGVHVIVEAVYPVSGIVNGCLAILTQNDKVEILSRTETKRCCRTIRGSVFTGRTDPFLAHIRRTLIIGIPYMQSR